MSAPRHFIHYSLARLSRWVSNTPGYPSNKLYTPQNMQLHQIVDLGMAGLPSHIMMVVPPASYKIWPQDPRVRLIQATRWHLIRQLARYATAELLLLGLKRCLRRRSRNTPIRHRTITPSTPTRQVLHNLLSLAINLQPLLLLGQPAQAAHREREDHG